MQQGSTTDRVESYRQRVLSERDALLRALESPHEAQHQVLTSLLAANAQTSFGVAHDFKNIRDWQDFRAAVPIRDYDALAPWINRAAGGEANVLSADDPVVYFMSSGSTGDSKQIPITREFMRTGFFPPFFAAWANFVEHFPDVIAREDSTLNLKHDPVSRTATTASGRPHLGASQVDFGAAFGEPLSAEPGFRAPWGTLPVPAGDTDYLEKAYLRLRLAVEHDVRCLIDINPAMVAAVPYHLDLWWPRIVKELRDGTLGGRPHGSPNPERAGGLEVRNATCRPVTAAGGSTPRYEFALAMCGSVDEREAAYLLSCLDGALRGLSTDYESAARTTGRLGEPVLHLLAEDAFLRDWQARVESGIRPAQVKDRVFQRDDGAWQRLLSCPHRLRHQPGPPQPCARRGGAHRSDQARRSAGGPSRAQTQQRCRAIPHSPRASGQPRSDAAARLCRPVRQAAPPSRPSNRHRQRTIMTDPARAIEYVVMCTPEGAPNGQLPKREVHHKDISLHLAFSCYLFDLCVRAAGDRAQQAGARAIGLADRHGHGTTDRGGRPVAPCSGVAASGHDSDSGKDQPVLDDPAAIEKLQPPTSKNGPCWEQTG
jgi:hypothetical protein